MGSTGVDEIRGTRVVMGSTGSYVMGNDTVMMGKIVNVKGSTEVNEMASTGDYSVTDHVMGSTVFDTVMGSCGVNVMGSKGLI